MAKDGQGADRLPAEIRLHQLEGFYFVATHEGFTRAADAMPYPITEPALHQQVRKLERALGAPLLERGPKRRMKLTPAGRSLYQFVAPYLEQLPGVLRGVSSGRQATLVVGTESLYVEELCAEALARLRPEAPEARLRLLELETPNVVQGVLRRDVDVGLVGGLRSVPRGLAWEELGTLGLELLVPAKHPLARKRPPLRPTHLEGLRCIFYEEGSLARAFTERAFSEAGITLLPAAEASSAQSMRALVRAGLAPAFVPALRATRPRRRVLPDSTVAFDLTELLEKMAGLPRFGLLFPTSRQQGGLAESFCTIVRDLVG